MSRRNPPVALVGSVHVLAPTGASPYYRLTWTDPDGRAGRTSGGRILEGATGKAHAIDANLSRAAGPASLTTLGAHAVGQRAIEVQGRRVLEPAHAAP